MLPIVVQDSKLQTLGTSCFYDPKKYSIGQPPEESVQSRPPQAHRTRTHTAAPRAAVSLTGVSKRKRNCGLKAVRCVSSGSEDSKKWGFASQRACASTACNPNLDMGLVWRVPQRTPVRMPLAASALMVTPCACHDRRDQSSRPLVQRAPPPSQAYYWRGPAEANEGQPAKAGDGPSIARKAPRSPSLAFQKLGHPGATCLKGATNRGGGG